MLHTHNKTEVMLAKRLIRYRSLSTKQKQEKNIYNATESENLVDKLIQYAINNDKTKTYAWAYCFSAWLQKQLSKNSKAFFCEQKMLGASNKTKEIYEMIVADYEASVLAKIKAA